MVFLVRGPLYLVAVSTKAEPTELIARQLHYVHAQIISILTSSVNKIFKARANYDLRGLLGGAEKFLDSVVSLMAGDASFLLGSVQCLRLNSSVRSAIGNIMEKAHASDLLYSILIAKHQLVTLVRPRKHILNPQGE